MDITLDKLRWRCNNDAARFQKYMELPEYFIQEELDQITIYPNTNIAHIRFKGGSCVQMSITNFHNSYSSSDRLEIDFVNKTGNRFHLAIFYNGRVGFINGIHKGDDYEAHKQIKVFTYE